MNLFRKLSRGFAWMTVGLICLAAFSLMLWAARTDAPIMDELAHIPAGYGYVHNLDYRLNPEHPPLIKALAMLPVLFLNPTFPVTNASWTTAINGEWGMGYEFLYNAGNNADQIVRTARIMPILITILMILLVYFLARKLIGDWWALLPTVLIAFDPTILGQGHYVTTDAGAAFGVLLSLLFFLKYVESPRARNLWLAGIMFGIAQLTKFSTPLLIPLYIFLVIVIWLRDTLNKRSAQNASYAALPNGESKKIGWDLGTLVHGLWKLLLIGLIGYCLVVYPVYFLFTAHEPITTQVTQTQSILSSFAGGPTPAGQSCRIMRCLANTDIKMAASPVLRPFGQYLLGLLMTLQRADGGNVIYFLGRVVPTGGPLYFPILYLLKEPIPTLMIVIIAFILALVWTIVAISKNNTMKKDRERVLQYLTLSFPEFSMASFIVLYWGYSVQSPLNIGIRHILPTLPLIAILAAVVWKKWILKFNINFSGVASFGSFGGAIVKTLAKSAAKYIFLILLLIWLILETLFAAPYFLSYFNEFGGGVSGGYHYVTDSNYDWGQDLWRLKSFVAANPAIDKIGVDYFGGGNPQYELGDREVNWDSTKGNPADQGIHWLAVSVNTLELATQPLAPGQTRNPDTSYSWLVALRPPQPGMGNLPPPDYRVGTSIFVYHW